MSNFPPSSQKSATDHFRLPQMFLESSAWPRRTISGHFSPISASEMPSQKCQLPKEILVEEQQLSSPVGRLSGSVSNCSTFTDRKRAVTSSSSFFLLPAVPIGTSSSPPLWPGIAHFSLRLRPSFAELTLLQTQLSLLNGQRMAGEEILNSFLGLSPVVLE